MWFGKSKAKRCYISLLVWIILVSFGLYWFMNRNGKQSHTAMALSSDLKGKGLDHSFKTGVKNDDNSNENSAIIDEEGNEDRRTKQKDAKKTNKKSLKSEGNLGKGKILLDSSQKYNNFINSYTNPSLNSHNKYLHSSVSRLCNPEESIKAQDENSQFTDYKLDALVILFRHGDRGPLSHIGGRNVSHINCTSDNPEFHNLIRFATDALTKQSGYSQFIGPFHSFPKVPSSTQCNLGQLTQQGASQLITLGKTIHSAYQSNIFNTTASLSHIKAISYSTRYRRTFQSLIAFLYGLLGPRMLIPSTTIRESQSITFCFNHCSCRAADKFKKVASKKYKPDNTEKAAMVHLINQLNSVVSTDKTKKTGTSLLDSLLIYPCHKAELPCRQGKSTMKDYISHNVKNKNSDCVTRKDLSNLIKLIQRENHGLKKISHNRKFFLLSSYGLLREIVTLALKMTSSSPTSLASASSYSNSNTNSNNVNSNSNNNNNLKLAIFSGHDTTLQSLTGALGILTGHPDIHLPPYASRLIFEFYRKTNVPPNSARKHFFRIVYNGQAVTHLVTFCKDLTSAKKINADTQGKTAAEDGNTSLLCPMENLLRFLLDNYFESFENSTNFKDACSPRMSSK